MTLDDFFRYQAQTTPDPIGLEVSHAQGSYIYDTSGKAYLDFVAGVSACSLGHCHPKVVQAVKDQLERYMHVMVYGEYIQAPAVAFAKLLASYLPARLQKTYLTNSGTEAMEGAMKLAKRATGRSGMIAAHRAYHGNTQGAMSIMGFEERKHPFRPLIPGTTFINFNKEEDLSRIDTDTAAVVLETIQGGAGFVVPEKDYLKKVRKRCDEVGALLILDEIQPGFGRTGKLFGFEHYKVVPDIAVMGKGMGGGMPVGAFTASKELMELLQDRPKLGHITTFGGHPVIAAACHATLQELTQTQLIQDTLQKEQQFRARLRHHKVKEIRGKGLMLAVMVDSTGLVSKILQKAMERGLILFGLLYEPMAIRITPPLTISKAEIDQGCDLLLEVLDETS